jgi:hypothetical protein
MPAAPTARDRAFYDVFISYRHRDNDKIDALEQKIRDAGFEPFRDLNFPELGDPGNVTRAKVETIRRQLSRSTCLLFAYSYQSAVHDREPGVSLGVWMPWELGFFDGAISSRIGVYLLDGRREIEDSRAYFKGSEYLQLYQELTDDDLAAFLKRNAVRERRIDNVAGASIWLEHLARECVANPANVSLGIAEWFADHAAAFWRAQGNVLLAEAFARWKVALDDLRVTTVPGLRFPLFDELRPGAPGARVLEGRPQSMATQAGPREPAGMTYAPQGPPPPSGQGLDALQLQALAALAVAERKPRKNSDGAA